MDNFDDQPSLRLAGLEDQPSLSLYQAFFFTSNL